ncbi:MAG: methylated-DNA--[protein]-cysteine S-methyltransferase [Methanobacteriaceae archaeon]|jgi:methylated-DNA-[protein]-cysteine S-methyltransferase|nr:methylated-DNA--[protein]-cysteine S-methyltransferase [Methanobacteriaceae archaeon]
MDKKLKKFTIASSIIGDITIIFWKKENDIIEEIILSNETENSEKIALEKYGELEEGKVESFDKYLNDYLSGKKVDFSLDNLNLEKCSDFEKSVLIAEFKTDYGSTNTYSELAEKINNPKSSRAVGNALAKNPFPVVIPCHRTIKKDKTIGNYTGGVKTKKKLLELEKNNI